MSFDFNLSDDEDNNSTISFTAKEDKDEWNISNNIISSLSGTSILNNNDVINDNEIRYDDDEDDDEEEDLAIEWEDGEETSFLDYQDDGDNDNNCSITEEKKLNDDFNISNKLEQEKEDKINITNNAFATTGSLLKDVTIELDINEETNEIEREDESKKNNKKKKKRTLSKIKLENLPNTVASLVLSLHRCHLLSLICHSMYVNNTICTSDILLHMTHSILPVHILDLCLFNNNINNTTASRNNPSEDCVKKICSWFSQYINNIHKRRMDTLNRNRHLGAPGRGISRRSQRQTRRAAPQSSSSSSKKTKKKSNNNDKSSKDSIMSTTIMYENLENRLLQLLQALSPIYEENPNEENLDMLLTIQTIEKTKLLLCIMRSLGYHHVRYVSSLHPISRDFTINHPLLYSTTSKFDRDNNDEESVVPTHPLVWLEVLCQSNHKPFSQKGIHLSTSSSTSTTNKKLSTSKNNNDSKRVIRKMNWLHVDIHHEVFNQPRVVESLQTNIIQSHSLSSSNDNNDTSATTSASASRNNKRNKNTKSRKITTKVIPVSYVIAIESLQHNSGNDKLNSCVITDVTPRYSNAWSQSLAIRGMTKMQILASQGYCIDEWWADTLQKFNASFGNRRNTRNVKRQKRKKVEEVIVIDSDIEDNNNNNSAVVHKKKKRKNDHNTIQNNPSTLQEEEEEEHHSFNEEQELQSSIFNEAIPTSKAAFKNHPCYAIPSVLNKDQVLHPSAKKRICGLFKGEIIYRRSDVSSAYSCKKWLYLHRKVKDDELSKPVIVRKPPKKKNNAKFKALSSYGVGKGNDGTEDTRQRLLNEATQELLDGDLKLYGLWQTHHWSPPYIGPSDPLPVNSHNNIDKKLLNPGLIHMEQQKLSLLAKKLGIPYAPCLLGFEGHRGNRTPTIKGIVVHQHNQMLLEEAYEEYQGSLIEKEYAKKQRDIYARWKRLIFGIITEDRLEREYGHNDNNDDFAISEVSPKRNQHNIASVRTINGDKQRRKSNNASKIASPKIKKTQNIEDDDEIEWASDDEEEEEDQIKLPSSDDDDGELYEKIETIPSSKKSTPQRRSRAKKPISYKDIADSAEDDNDDNYDDT